MADFIDAGVLELSDPAEKVYDRYGSSVTIQAVQTREYGNQGNDPLIVDATLSIEHDPSAVVNVPGTQRVEPDPANPGEYIGLSTATYRWTQWVTPTEVVRVELELIELGGAIHWSVFEDGNTTATP